MEGTEKIGEISNNDTFDNLFCSTFFYRDWLLSEPHRHLVSELKKRGFDAKFDNTIKNKPKKSEIMKSIRENAEESHKELVAMINNFLKGVISEKSEKQKTLWENFLWRLHHAELVRNFSDDAEVKDAMSCLTDEMIELFSNDKKFEKFMFKRLLDKPFKDLEIMVKDREFSEFRLPSVETMLMKAYIMHLYKSELGFKDIYEMPSTENFKKLCQNKCKLFTLENKKSLEATYIDKLFGYKKSIKEINSEFGWLSLYQKYINGLKAYAGIEFNSVQSLIVKKRKIRIYRF